MDITKLTGNHIVFIPHPEVANYYCIDPLQDDDTGYYFMEYMPMHNSGQVMLPSFAIHVDREFKGWDFIEFLQSAISTGHIKINDTPGNYLYRDFYEFKTFDGHEQWAEKYRQHKEAQRRFWLLQGNEEKKKEAVQKSLFE